MAHNRKYVPGGIDLVMCRLKYSGKLMEQDKVEKLIIDSCFLDEAPFKWIGLVFLYGIKNDLKPRYRRIDKKDGELEIKIELDTGILEWADVNDLKLMYDIFMIGALDVLIDIGKKYKLKYDLILEERKKYGNIPNTIEECLVFKAVGPDYKIKVNRCPNCKHIRKTLEASQCLNCGQNNPPRVIEE